ncbi:MAG: DUF2868 domain-containing protein [Pseudomonadota bacterium]
MQLTDDLNAHILCEATRVHEQTHPQVSAHANALAKDTGHTFTEKLLIRSQHLDSAPQLKADIGVLQRRKRRVLMVCLALSVMLGVVLSQALLLRQNDTGVNVYVLLSALLLPNLISMLILCALLCSKQTVDAHGLKRSWLGKLIRRAVHGLRGKALTVNPSVTGWSSVYLNGDFAKWWLNSWGQALWLAFLVGNLLGVILRLSVHQYYFGWESTLLPNDFFIGLTQVLSAPLHALGFNVPLNQDVLASHLSGGEYVTRGLAIKWAQFILGSVLVYAILPRLLFTAYAWHRQRQAQRALSLNVQQLAYSKLYQILMLDPVDTDVVDPDDHAHASEVASTPSVDTASFSAGGVVLPPNTVCVGVDLTSARLAHLSATAPFLGMAVDRASQKQVVASLTQGEYASRPVCVLLSLNSVPDRGVVRYLTKLSNASSELFVNVIDGQDAQARLSADEFSQRIFDWHSALNALGVHNDHVTMLEDDSAELKALLSTLAGSEP